jgi:hypothetical protein
MPNTAKLELQQALYQALSADGNLTSLLGSGKIYDHVPQRTKPPYVTIGMTLEREWNTSTEDGREHVITFHSWTENKGRKQALEILVAIEQAILSAPLVMTTQALVNKVFEFNEVRRDPDGETIHGITRFQMKTEPL